MKRRVMVRFGDGNEHVLEVEDAARSAAGPDEARAWLVEQFAEAGCVPSNPMGKVLTADLLLGVAAAAGPERLVADPAWSLRYAVAALQLRGADAVVVDVAAYAVR